MNPVTALPVQKEKYRFAGTAALTLVSQEEDSVSASVSWSVNLKAGVAGLPDKPLVFSLPQEEISFLEPERSYPVFAHCVKVKNLVWLKYISILIRGSIYPIPYQAPDFVMEPPPAQPDQTPSAPSYYASPNADPADWNFVGFTFQRPRPAGSGSFGSYPTSGVTSGFGSYATSFGGSGWAPLETDLASVGAGDGAWEAVSAAVSWAASAAVFLWGPSALLVRSVPSVPAALEVSAVSVFRGWKKRGWLLPLW